MSNRAIFVLYLFIALTATLSEAQEKYRTDWGKRETPRFPKSPKVYEINLELPYEDRWREVIQDHRQAIDSLLGFLWIRRLPLGVVDYFVYSIAHHYNPTFAEEVQALANLVENSFTKLLVLNFMYDLGAACSSILVQDTDDKIIHARTLDFGLTPYITKLVFHGKYYKGGKLLYEAIDVAGYTGIVTGYKPGAYSFSLNEYMVEPNASILKMGGLVISYFKQFFKGYITPPYVIRKAFEQAEDYDSLIRILCDTEITSRVYYIVAGPEKGQGVVITKFQDRVKNITTLNAENGRWFVAQTNYERDIPDPENDNRRTAEHDRLEAIGRDKVNVDNLFKEVMDVYPTFNLETIHTTTMVPSQDYFETTVWYDK